MKNYKIIVEYDGTKYFGWQRQKEHKKYPTVQGELENALERIFCKKVAVTGSGRTDTGVHALGQCASFKTNTKIPISNIFQGVNTYLPEDIRVKKIKEAPPSFNARFSAKKKWYRYAVYNSKIPSVFNKYYEAFIYYTLDISLMKKAARLIKGRHNFSAFILGDRGEKVREIYKLNVTKKNNFIYVDVVGGGFLYKMVRRIVSVLLDVGRKKMTIEDVKKLIACKKINCAVQTAPAKGLMLMKVYY